MTTLAIDPHGDDLALFASFTVQRLRPHVVVCFDSYLQPARGAQGCDWETRRQETLAAMIELCGVKWTGDLGVPLPPGIDITFLGLRDDQPADLRGALWQFVHKYDHIIYPAYEEGGHDQHNAVALACREIFNDTERHMQYLTYTRTHGKSSGVEVPPQSADELQRKLRALACFRSQMQPDPRIGCAEWFYANDFREYVL